MIDQIYECLGGLSIRSLAYAIADLYTRATLGEVNWDKALEILAQNLAGYLRTSPSVAKRIIEQALKCDKGSDHQLHTAFVGSVGEEKAPTLAHLVNKYVAVDSSPRIKLEIIKKLNLQRDNFEYVKSVITARSEGSLYMKSAIRLVHNRYFNASFSDIDFIKTVFTMRRKNALGRPISSSDIYIREYIHIIDKPVYIALDVSGSMKEYLGNATKLKVAKNAVARYLVQMAYVRGTAALVLFNTDADFLWTPYPVYKYLREMLEILRYVYAAGGTELASALELLHANGARGDVVIITDGRTRDPERIMALASRFRRIHVVAVEKSQFLKHLAKTTGGKYRELSPRLDIFELHS
ncbi:MAG: vWA domain-containing protein [Pyrobaculum sp.]